MIFLADESTIRKNSQVISSGNTTPNIDISKGTTASLTITGDTTISLSNSNSNASNGIITLTLFITDGGSHTITWPASVSWLAGSTPSLKASGIDIIYLTTNNNGTNWYGDLAGSGNSSGGGTGGNSYTAGNGLTLTDTEFSLSASGATAGTYGNNTTSTLSYGDTFNIPKYVIDKYGRITSTSDIALTLPSSSGSGGTTYSAGTGLTLNGTIFNHSNSITAGTVGSATAIPIITYDSTGHITSITTSSVQTPNNLVLKVNSGTTEGTNLYTFDGSVSKTLDIVAGNNVTLTASTGTLTIASSYTNTTYTAGTGLSLTGTVFSTDNSIMATKDYVTSSISTAIANIGDAMVFRGTLGTSGTITALPATHSTGDTYKIITAGTYAGQVCEIGDLIICITDGTASNDADWTVVQTNEDGIVTGPASSTDTHIATFDGTTGKIIKDSGFTIATSVPSGAKFTDTNTTYTAGNGLTLTDTEFSLSASGATAGNYGTATNTTLTSGGTFTIPYYTVDTYGRLTNSSNVIMTLPESSTGTSSNTDKINVTLLAADWVSTNQATTGYYTYTISNTSILATSLAELEPNIQTATLSQLSSYQVANIFIGTISAGTMELRAYGDVPTVDIPITLKLNNSNTSSQVEQSITFRDNTGTVVSYNGTNAVDLSNGVYSRNSGIPLFSINSDMKLVATFADSKDAGTFSVNSDGKLVYTLE